MKVTNAAVARRRGLAGSVAHAGPLIADGTPTRVAATMVSVARDSRRPRRVIQRPVIPPTLAAPAVVAPLTTTHQLPLQRRRHGLSGSVVVSGPITGTIPGVPLLPLARRPVPTSVRSRRILDPHVPPYMVGIPAFPPAVVVSQAVQRSKLRLRFGFKVAKPVAGVASTSPPLPRGLMVSTAVKRSRLARGPLPRAHPINPVIGTTKPLRPGTIIRQALTRVFLGRKLIHPHVAAPAVATVGPLVPGTFVPAAVRRHNRADRRKAGSHRTVPPYLGVPAAGKGDIVWFCGTIEPRWYDWAPEHATEWTAEMNAQRWSTSPDRTRWYVDPPVRS